MISTEKQNKYNEFTGKETKEIMERFFPCCNRQRLHRNRSNRGIRFGILVILIGLFWYGIKVNWFPVQWINSSVFAPIVLMFVGAWVLVGSILRKRSYVLSKK